MTQWFKMRMAHGIEPGGVVKFGTGWFENSLSVFIRFSHLDPKLVPGNTRPLPPPPRPAPTRVIKTRLGDC